VRALAPRGEKVARVRAPVVRVARSNWVEMDRGIVKAFGEVRDGFPVDRVIADPELNQHFIAECARLEVPGSAAEWNQRLMNLRKRGQLKELAGAKETVIAAEERAFDRYGFACEIAIEHFEREGTTLEHVLCDPKLAQGFDQYVLAMLPDRPGSLAIRWSAMRIRKNANRVAQASASLERKMRMAREAERPFGLELEKVPATPGLYWLMGEKKPLYVGETANLRERFAVQFDQSVKFDFWGTARQQLHLSFRSVAAPARGALAKQQARWIKDWRPIGNYRKLATGAARQRVKL
jgi:hypothetical protein